MRIDGDAALWAGPSEADSLLLLLHGRGADERDLLPLAERLGVPDRIVALRGPVPSQGGRAWAEATPTPDGDSAVAPAGDAVLDWLDRLPGTAPKRIRVLGFSQGCAVALQLLRSAPDRFERVVMLSGFVAEVGGPADAALAARRPPVFWARHDRSRHPGRCHRPHEDVARGAHDADRPGVPDARSRCRRGRARRRRGLPGLLTFLAS